MTRRMNEMVVQAEPSNDRGRPTVFVGRDAELRVLQEVLERALAGAGQLVLVSGEPGIGKTRTTEHLTERARASGALVLWGNCYEWDGAPAYWPWAQALRAWFRTLDDDTLRATLGGQAALVAQIVPEL